MDFFETVARRRSVRSYHPEPVPDEAVDKAIDAALLAPNSSNLQMTRIYWVRDPEKKRRLALACLNQSAARTAPDLVVFTSDLKGWKKSVAFILDSFGDAAPAPVRTYYGRLIPFLYGWALLDPVKWLLFQVLGLTRPMIRGPASRTEIREVCVKSAALACENFMLAIAAQGYDTCPMEGFDAVRVRRLLGLSRHERIVMVISVGRRDDGVPLFQRYRLPRSETVRRI